MSISIFLLQKNLCEYKKRFSLYTAADEEAPISNCDLSTASKASADSVNVTNLIGVNASIQFLNNQSTNSGRHGLLLNYSPTPAAAGHVSLDIENNLVQGAQGSGLHIGGEANNGSLSSICVKIINNDFEGNANYGVSIRNDNGISALNAAVNGNVFHNNSVGGFTATATSGSVCLQMDGNIATNNADNDYSFFPSGGSDTVDIEDYDTFGERNVGNVTSIPSASVPPGTCNCE